MSDKDELTNINNILCVQHEFSYETLQDLLHHTKLMKKSKT